MVGIIYKLVRSRAGSIQGWFNPGLVQSRAGLPPDQTTNEVTTLFIDMQGGGRQKSQCHGCAGSTPHGLDSFDGLDCAVSLLVDAHLRLSVDPEAWAASELGLCTQQDQVQWYIGCKSNVPKSSLSWQHHPPPRGWMCRREHHPPQE